MALCLIFSYVSGSCIFIGLLCGVWAVLEVWLSERHGLNHLECMTEFIVISIVDLGFNGFIKIRMFTGDGEHTGLVAIGPNDAEVFIALSVPCVT